MSKYIKTDAKDGVVKSQIKDALNISGIIAQILHKNQDCIFSIPDVIGLLKKDGVENPSYQAVQAALYHHAGLNKRIVSSRRSNMFVAYKVDNNMRKMYKLDGRVAYVYAYNTKGRHTAEPCLAKVRVNNITKAKYVGE